MHKSQTGDEYWNSVKFEIIKLYNEGISTNKIGEMYGCYGSTIRYKLKEWNVEIRSKRYNALYSANVDYFEKIDTDQKAYFLGIIVSDGHVSKRNTIMLTLKDIDVIEKWKTAINYNHDIKIDRYGNYYLNLTSKKMADDLRRIGLTNNKSYVMDIEKIVSYVPKEFERDFVRGLIDGDGSITIYKYPYQSNISVHFGFTGLKQTVEYVKNFLNITTKDQKDSDITYTCRSSCRETLRYVYESVYKNSTIYMDRKYNTLLKIIES